MIDFFKANIGKHAGEMSPSAAGRWLNGKLVAVDEGSLSVEFVVRDEMTNPGQILHGGIATTMMDDVMGMTVFSLGRKEFYATINIALDFLRPARVGDVLTAKSRVIRGGDSVINMECELLHADGKLVARCISNMVKSKF